MIRRLSLASTLAVTLIAAPAFGAEEEGVGPTATAPPPSSVADPIEAYLNSSPVNRLPAEDEPLGVTGSADPRRPHGEVSVGVGTHGYRSVYLRSDMPLGETGSVSISIGDERFGGFHGHPAPFPGRGVIGAGP